MSSSPTTQHTGEPEVPKKVLHRAIGASAIGNAVEWFDYGVYAYMTTHIAAALFPEGDNAVFFTLVGFAISFLIRPIGSMFWGPLGDKIGRKRVLAMTILLMAAATLCVGLIPSYETIGIAAPVILYLLRIVQGFSAGGEYGGAATFMAEYSPDRKRGFYGSFLEVGTLVGFTLGNGIALILVNVLSADDLQSWGWRIPFLIAAPLLVAAVIYRLKVEDSPLFLQMVEEAAPPKAPVTEVLRDHRGGLLRLVGLAYSTLTTGALASVYLVVHLSGVLKYPLSSSLWLTVLIILLPIGIIPWAGALSDRFGRKRLAATGMLGFVVLSVPCFWAMQQDSLLLAIVAALVLNVPFAIQQGVVYTMYAELFPTRVRYSGVSLGFNIGGIVGTGTASLIATSLVAATGVTLAPAFYAVFAAVVGLLMLLTFRETAGEKLANGTRRDGDDATPVPATAEH